MLLWDILLGIGIAMVLVGVIDGGYHYKVYAAGRSEHIANTIVGTLVVPEEAPGNPGRKASAVVGFAAAGVGALLMGFSLVAFVVGGRRGHGSPEEQEPRSRVPLS